MADPIKIMLIAGEPSGDAHAAKLVAAIRERSGTEAEFFGSAGPAMRSQGVEAVVRADDLAIIGVPEIAAALPMFIGAFRTLKRSARERRPDAVILVDLPEFNLKLARSLKRMGLTVIYYISPQLWAWRSYRRRTIAKHVDLLLTILPFEKAWYAERGIRNVEYVGNPLAGHVMPTRSRKEFRSAHGIDEADTLVALLPGSRSKELRMILPPMLRSAELMRQRDPEIRFAIALAPGRGSAEVDEILADPGLTGKLVVVENDTYSLLAAADAAAVASGTATLETAIIGTPMAVVYKASSFNYKLVTPLINVEHFALVNLVAGERMVKEMIQDDFTPEALAAELTRLLGPAVNAEARSRSRELAAKLGKGGSAEKAADLVLELIRKEG